MSNNKYKIKDVLASVMVVIILYLILNMLNVGCPIKYLTGISCAGCGMTRAYLSLMHLDFEGAFSYHPLFALPIIWMFIYIHRTHIKPYLYKFTSFTFILLFVIIYAIRLIDSNDSVVVF